MLGSSHHSSFFFLIPFWLLTSYCRTLHADNFTYMSQDFQLTLWANSKVDTQNTLCVCKLGACATGTATRWVGKIGPHGPLPLAQSAACSMGITARVISNIHTYIHTYISESSGVFFFKQKTAYEISACLVGSEMCIRDRSWRECRELLLAGLGK